MPKGLGADYTVSVTELQEIAREFMLAGEVPMIWGPPGIGKSQSIHQAAADAGYEMHDIRALQLDPVDVRGLPHLADGVTHWAAPGFLPSTDSEDNHLIFFDELPSAPPSVQAALYQLIQGPLHRRLPAAEGRFDDRGWQPRVGQGTGSPDAFAIGEPLRSLRCCRTRGRTRVDSLGDTRRHGCRGDLLHQPQAGRAVPVRSKVVGRTRFSMSRASGRRYPGFSACH